ncbi:flagellar biosynthesis anti-sigma factor FlgM [Clostridium autoethanogenum]|jgi:negative regulator of flagellin synthesis FlgM|uniref:Negative regulator of flagellin synthesis n=1 Tax=Clostridium autoethanogenum TaxID=84023 RepID=A0A3M0SKP2_9CLOT|nr:flagellar biosynthesis anti-sigma factor FlgM [Clostridium autoethanogenum]RMC99086.1 flagellar biosynthesis anti-sigma factor FlgM [Clostridium autoethanogenum]
MKINGINSSKLVNFYNRNNVEKSLKSESNSKDSIHISSIGKSLSPYSLDDKFVNSKERVESIKKSVANGTYKVDSKLVAQKIIDNIKGKI